MCQILNKYDIHPDFLRVVFSFGEEPHLAEASSGNLAIHSSRPGQTGKLTSIRRRPMRSAEMAVQTSVIR
jgi:hypothetical protein